MLEMEEEMHCAAASSSEEERDDKIRIRGSRYRVGYQTPFKGNTQFFKPRSSTPATVTQMTPSPIRTPLVDMVSPNPGTAPTRAPTPPSTSFISVQQGYLDNSLSTALFRDETPSRARRKSKTSSRQSRLSESLLLENYGMEQRRRVTRKQSSFGSTRSSQVNSSPDVSSVDTSPESSPCRMDGTNCRSPSLVGLDVVSKSHRGRSLFVWGLCALALTSVLGMVFLTRSAVQSEQFYEPTRPEIHLSAAGLRGQMTSGHWEGKDKKPKPSKPVQPHHDTHTKQDTHSKVDANTKVDAHTKHHHAATKPNSHHHQQHAHSKHEHHKPSSSHHHDRHEKARAPVRHASLPKLHLPLPPLFKRERKFDVQDPSMYSKHSSASRRVVALDPTNTEVAPPRSIKLYPADFTDNTQLYSILDSSDERLGHMELREPYTQGECVPMQDWQTTFHPSCNGMHEIAIESMGEDNGNSVQLFGTKGFWRYAWKLDVQNVHEQDTMVLKTLKFQHNFEDAHFEHDRIDAVAMERLTSSPHVINVFGFCGHSVLTEYADGSRVGELADKSKKKPLVRLKIARDIALGLADVHGIDGDGNATFVHLDVNPANVVSVGGTLKLNDFNIGIIRRWNITSNTPCGFPAQYPNPQWRSPEEARNEQNLTEKVDVFSMGHIFFRLICGHEPWNKLEPGGRPSKEEVTIRVQRGDLPYIPDDVRYSEDPEIMAIRDAMLSCYTFDPVKRPSARDVANSLDKALEAMSSKQL